MTTSETPAASLGEWMEQTFAANRGAPRRPPRTTVAVKKEQIEEAQRLLGDAQQALHTFYDLLLCAMDTGCVLNPHGMTQLLGAPMDNLRDGFCALMNACDLAGPGQVAVKRGGKLRMEPA